MKINKRVFVSQSLHPVTGEIIFCDDRQQLFQRLQKLFPHETVQIFNLVQKDLAKSLCANRVSDSVIVVFE